MSDRAVAGPGRVPEVWRCGPETPQRTIPKSRHPTTRPNLARHCDKRLAAAVVDGRLQIRLDDIDGVDRDPAHDPSGRTPKQRDDRQREAGVEEPNLDNLVREEVECVGRYLADELPWVERQSGQYGGVTPMRRRDTAAGIICGVSLAAWVRLQLLSPSRRRRGRGSRRCRRP